jgi:hypothetical protein
MMESSILAAQFGSEAACSPNTDARIGPVPIYSAHEVRQAVRMKGMSVVFTLLLFVLATQLAVRLRQARVLPAQQELRNLLHLPLHTGYTPSHFHHGPFAL